MLQPSAKGKPTDPKLREEAKEGANSHLPLVMAGCCRISLAATLSAWTTRLRKALASTLKSRCTGKSACDVTLLLRVAISRTTCQKACRVWLPWHLETMQASSSVMVALLPQR